MGKGDMFLKVEGTRSGPIKGEACDESHRDEIDIVSWSWGIRAQTGMGAGGTATKATLRELNFVKAVDSSSCALMNAMRNNDPLKSVVLTCRKAGSSAMEYLKVTIKGGRITALDVESGGGDDPAELVERISMSYDKISIEYTPQGGDGQRRGGMQFEAETT